MLQVQQQHLDKESKRHSLTSFSRLYIQMKESISFILLEHVCLTRIKRCLELISCARNLTLTVVSPINSSGYEPQVEPIVR